MSMNYEKANRNEAAIRARIADDKEEREVNKIGHKYYRRLARIKMARLKRQKAPVVSHIHWVKDTPQSLALQFLEWKHAKQR